MNTILYGTAALITGASSGIGEATALLLAEHGASVAVAARRKDRLDALVKRIEGAGGKAIAIEADVTQKEHAKKAVDETVAAFGRLDTLVNNAGVMLLGPIVDADPTEWERMISLNVTGLMYCTNAALPHLLKAAESEHGADSPTSSTSVPWPDASRAPAAASTTHRSTRSAPSANRSAKR